MLLTTPNEFNWRASNVGATFTDAGLGTSLAAGGANHTKGSTTTLLSAIAEDCYWIAILFTGGAVSTASRRFLADIYVDPAGGTAWESSPRIANLAANSPSLVQGGVLYHFPLFIPAGSSIGAAVQAETTLATVRCSIRVFGKPSNPESLKTGSKVVTYGASTGTTVGTSFTPGASGAMGSYSASLGTTSYDHWFWQMGMLINDTSQTAVQYLCDLAVGDASNKRLVIEQMQHTNAGTTEVAGSPSAWGMGSPWRRTKAGDLIYVRGACTGTADSNLSAIAYAVAP